MLGIEWLARPGIFTASVVVYYYPYILWITVFYIEGRIQQNVHETVHSIGTELPDKILYVRLSSSSSVATTVNTERPCGEFYIGS